MKAESGNGEARQGVTRRTGAPHTPKAKLTWPQLTEELTAELADLMLDGMTSKKAQGWLQRELRVRAPLAFFTNFWNMVCLPRLESRRATAVATANAVAVEMGREVFRPAVVDALRQRVFELCLAPPTEPDTLKAFLTLLIRERAQWVNEEALGLERRKVAVMEAKVQAAAQQIQKLRDPDAKLSEAERLAILNAADEILGV